MTRRTAGGGTAGGGLADNGPIDNGAGAGGTAGGGAAEVVAAGGLVTLGETMGLLTPMAAGPLRHAPGLRLSIAGAESNVAIGVRRLGGGATWFGRVGQDEVGDLVLREMRAEGVTVRAVRDPAPTGLMLKTAPTAGVTRVSYYRAASAGSRLGPDDLDESVIAAAGVLHVTGITPALGPGPAAAVRAAVQIARGHGVTVSLDVNYRSALWDGAAAAAALRDLVAEADVVFAGEQEAVLLAGRGLLADQAPAGPVRLAGRGPLTDPGLPAGPGDPGRLARQLASLGPQQAIVKRGARGSVAFVDGAILYQQAIGVRAVDPVGAGDAFVAGYLAELLAGRPPETRLATAAAVGAFAVTVQGDWEGLPSRSDLALLGAADDVIR